MGVTDESLRGRWFSWYVCAFLLGAATGGLTFGWIGDHWGRARALGWSVLTYSLLSGMCYFVSTPEQLLFLWFLACTGVGGVCPNGVSLCVLVLVLLPESPAWLAQREQWATKSRGDWLVSEVFRPPLLRYTILGILLGAVPLMGNWGSANWLVPWANQCKSKLAAMNLARRLSGPSRVARQLAAWSEAGLPACAAGGSRTF